MSGAGARAAAPDARVPAVALQPIRDPADWRAEEMRGSETWIHHFSAGERAEIHAAVAAVEAAGLDFLDIDRARFPLPRLAGTLAEIRRELLYGRGFVLLRGLDIDLADRRRAALAFWGVGMHLGDGAWSQNARGHVLGHVRDIGQSKGNVLQRGPYSREGIPYHCDACDVVGLYCLHPARSGGASSIVSSVRIHNELLARRPDMVEALMQPIWRDRRGEVPPGCEEFYAIPVFNVHEGWFSANVEPTYIGSAERFPEVPRKSALQREALETVQRMSDELHFAMGFRQGDMQFINNHVTFHSRTAYEEFDEPERKRHLLRLWLRCDDGRPLPHWFYDRHGPAGSVSRPGGIVGPDTVLNTPLEAA